MEICRTDLYITNLKVNKNHSNANAKMYLIKLFLIFLTFKQLGNPTNLKVNYEFFIQNKNIFSEAYPELSQMKSFIDIVNSR